MFLMLVRDLRVSYLCDAVKLLQISRNFSSVLSLNSELDRVKAGSLRERKEPLWLQQVQTWAVWTVSKCVSVTPAKTINPSNWIKTNLITHLILIHIQQCHTAFLNCNFAQFI